MGRFVKSHRIRHEGELSIFVTKQKSMTRALIILLLILPMLSFGQETKKITDKDNREVYYVLKSDESVRQGNYQQMDYKGKIIINGYYKNGLKDSTWTEYYWGGNPIKSRGSYSNDEKSDIWE